MTGGARCLIPVASFARDGVFARFAFMDEIRAVIKPWGRKVRPGCAALVLDRLYPGNYIKATKWLELFGLTTMSTPIASIKSFYKGQVIFREGQEATVAFMIKKGAVNIFRSASNKKIILARLKEGEIFGEMGVLTQGPRTANAEAAEYCELLVLTDQLLKSLLKQCPKTIQHLTNLLIDRLKKTDTMIPPTQHMSTFISICNILEMAYENHVKTPADEAKKIDNYDLGLNYNKFCKIIKEIILVSQLDLDNILDKLHKLNILSITNLKNGSKAFSEKYVKIADLDTFNQVTRNLFKELQKSEFSQTTEMSYVDIKDFADHVESTPEMIYKKISQEDFPESMFFFPRTQAFTWADQQGKEFFQKAKKKKKKIQDLEDVDDIIYVDNATIKEMLSQIGYYKIGVLLAIAEEEAKKKILANLAKKIAAAVQEESQGRHVDDSEAEDVVDEMFTLIREIKGVE